MRIKEGKRIIQALAVILLLFVLFGLQRFQAGSETGVLPERIMDDKYRTCYEIFVYSFADSDGDGIGDLRGVLEHLDYICDGDPSTDTDLGCNEIWLTPVCPSPTYHKYDVTDYCDIDPQYGTMTDYDALIEACHARGIRVINDMVMNHSSVAHPWFTEAAAYLRTLPAGEEPDAAVCPTVDWYRFSREPQKGYEPLPGTEWYYEARFWSGMPDFNLENPEVRQAFREIAAFWLAHGCDGFRMDAVTSYETDDTEGSVAELARFAEDVHALSPEAYIVGEAWADVATYARFYDSGIDSLFDFDFADSEGAIAKAVRGNLKADQFAQRIVDNEGLFAAHNPDYINAPFYTNHDMARSAGYYLKQGEACTKQAEGLNLLMGGNAFLYYGEELGMRGSGRDENKRAPMLWSNDPDAPGMCAGPPEMETIEHKYGSLAAQASDPESIYQYVKRAIRLRNTFPAIARGESRMVEALSDERVCVLERRVLQEDSAACGEAVILVINLDPEPRMLDLKADPSTAAAELAGMLTISPEESVVETPERMLQLPGRGIAILQAAAEEQ